MKDVTYCAASFQGRDPQTRQFLTVNKVES